MAKLHRFYLYVHIVYTQRKGIFIWRHKRVHSCTHHVKYEKYIAWPTRRFFHVLNICDIPVIHSVCRICFTYIVSFSFHTYTFAVFLYPAHTFLFCLWIPPKLVCMLHMCIFIYAVYIHIIKNIHVITNVCVYRRFPFPRAQTTNV